MVKRFLLVLMIVCGLIVFGTCSATTSDTSTACDGSCPLPKPTNKLSTTISQENWSLVVPSADYASSKLSSPDMKIFSQNIGQGCRILMLKEPTNQIISDYVVANIKAVSSFGAVVSSIKQVVINGNRFIEVQVDMGDQTTWSWTMVNDGFGYVFQCGGEVNSDAGNVARDVCQSIAESLTIR